MSPAVFSYRSSLLFISYLWQVVSEPVFDLGFCEMSSLKFDLPQLDYTTRFALWQVKMRAILAQSSDLDEAIDAFGGKAKETWTDPEKRKDRKALSLIQLHLSNNILQEVL